MPLYITLPVLLLPRETAQVSQKPRVPRDNCSLLLCATLRIASPVALPITLKFQSGFPCSAAAFHCTAWQTCSPLSLCWGSSLGVRHQSKSERSWILTLLLMLVVQCLCLHTVVQFHQDRLQTRVHPLDQLVVDHQRPEQNAEHCEHGMQGV